MAHSISAKKRIRQNIKRRAHNRARKVQIKDQIKSFTAALTGGDLGILSAAADHVERWLQSRCGDGVRVERLLVSVEELRG